jgi:hypothetical protein
MSKQREPLPDEAVVVRCGAPPFLGRPLYEACVQNEEVFGFSVQSAVALDVRELAKACPNNTVGSTTVGQIRSLGYNVVVTSGRGHQATVVVPPDWTREQAGQLSTVFQSVANPSARRRP